MPAPEHIGLFTTLAPLILASASPRRKSLLAELGLCFSVQVAAIDEDPDHEEPPESFVRRLAEEKALAVSRKNLLPVFWRRTRWWCSTEPFSTNRRTAKRPLPCCCTSPAAAITC